MRKPANINTLTALRERKAALTAEASTARQGLTSTLAKTPATAKEYALEDLAIPALGVGLAIYVGYRLLRSKPEQLPIPYAQPAYEAPLSAQVPFVHAKESKSARGYAVPKASPPPAKKSGFNFSSIISAGKMLVPVVQAVVGIVQNQQLDKVEHQVKQTKQEVVEEVN